MGGASDRFGTSAPGDAGTRELTWETGRALRTVEAGVDIALDFRAAGSARLVGDTREAGSVESFEPMDRFEVSDEVGGREMRSRLVAPDASFPNSRDVAEGRPDVRPGRDDDRGKVLGLAKLVADADARTIDVGRDRVRLVGAAAVAVRAAAAATAAAGVDPVRL